MERLRHYFHVDMANLLEADPDVVTWTTSLDAIPLPGEPTGKGFTPAFRVQGKSGIRYIHLVNGPVKSVERVERHGVLREQCRMQGASFAVVTRDDVARHPKLTASKDILFHRTFDWPPELPLRASAITAVEHPKTLGEMHSRLGGTYPLWQQLLSLVARGYIDVDMGFDVGPQMPILRVSPTGHLG